MFEKLRQALRSKYVRLLEEEVARERAENERLRAENRALMNSLLGTAGFPPVEFPEPPKPQPLPRLRKRSWHQIQAWRENGARFVRPDPVGTARDAGLSFDEKSSERANGPVPLS